MDTHTPHHSSDMKFKNFGFRLWRTYSLGERTALADGDPVTLLNTESGGNVGGEVLVALFVTRVLRDEVDCTFS